MNEESYQRGKSIEKWLSKKKVQVLIGVVTLVAGGVIGKFEKISENNELFKSGKTVMEMKASTDTNSEVGWIYVTGAVAKPGMYKYQNGMRVADSILQAGGFHKNVDKEYVSKELNVIDEMKSGQQLHIPYQKIKQQESVGAKLEKNEEVSRQVSINNSSTSELESLKGIGEVRAKEIISNRPYQDLYGLVESGVLSEDLFNKLENQLKL